MAVVGGRGGEVQEQGFPRAREGGIRQSQQGTEDPSVFPKVCPTEHQPLTFPSKRVPGQVSLRNTGGTPSAESPSAAGGRDAPDGWPDTSQTHFPRGRGWGGWAKCQQSALEGLSDTLTCRCKPARSGEEDWAERAAWVPPSHAQTTCQGCSGESEGGKPCNQLSSQPSPQIRPPPPAPCPCDPPLAQAPPPGPPAGCSAYLPVVELRVLPFVVSL